MQKEIDRLSGHVIICGFGRVGQMLGRDLAAARHPFVILERSDDRVAAASGLGYLCLKGDVTDEDVLRQAGVTRARALATVLPDDAANVFITLSARSLNPTLMIIARGELTSSESKLIQAGADRVVLPARIGAERMAELLIHKDVTKLISDTQGGTLERLANDLQRLGLDIEIVTVETGSRAAGATIADVEALGAGTFLVVALERRDGETLLQPHNEVSVRAGDGIAVVGRPGRARALDRLFTAPPLGETLA
jgi:Trk K+ transport system NAD-binding subunit